MGAPLPPRRRPAAPSILPKTGWAIAHPAHLPLTPLFKIIRAPNKSTSMINSYVDNNYESANPVHKYKKIVPSQVKTVPKPRRPQIYSDDIHGDLNYEYDYKYALSLAASMYFWSVSLVYQLSGQFLIFLVDQKKIWSTKNKFGIPKRNLVDQKKSLVNQKNIWYTKKKFGRPKKSEIDWTIGIPKRLTKSTWTPLLLTITFFIILSPHYPIFEKRLIVSIVYLVYLVYLSFMVVLIYQICRYVYKIYKCFYSIYQCVYFPYQCFYFTYQCVYFMYQCLYFFFISLYIISTCVVSICTFTINLILMLSFEIKSKLSLEHSAIFLSNLADELLDPEI